MLDFKLISNSINLYGIPVLLGIMSSVLMIGSLVSIFLVGVNSISIMGIGSVLFMISDYILIINRFVIKNNKWFKRGIFCTTCYNWSLQY